MPEEQDPASVPPNRLEPRGLGAGMQEGDAVIVLGEFGDPIKDAAAVERRVQPNKLRRVPVVSKTVVNDAPILMRAPPRCRVGSRGVEIKRAETVNNPTRRNMGLGFAD